jgi:hypothetical protein
VLNHHVGKEYIGTMELPINQKIEGFARQGY